MARYTKEELTAICTEMASQLTRDYKNPFGVLRTMLGTKSAMVHEDAEGRACLMVRFAKFPGCKSNNLTIRLDHDDTYTCSLHYCTVKGAKVIKETSGLYCDMLTDWFWENTGLACTMVRFA